MSKTSSDEPLAGSPEQAKHPNSQEILNELPDQGPQTQLKSYILADPLSDSSLLGQARNSYIYHILLQRRTLLLLLVLTLVAGLFLGGKLSVGLYPKVERAKINIGWPSGDLPPSEFFQKYGQNLEQSLKTLEGVSEISGNYSPYWNSYELTFDWGIASANAKRKVEQLFSSLASGLPKESRENYTIDSYTQGSVIYMTFDSETLPPNVIYQLTERKLATRFRTIPGVAKINTFPVEQLISNVILNRQKMLQYGISPAQLANNISSQSGSATISNIWVSGEYVNLRLQQTELSLYGLDNLVIAERSGQPIYLKDIANIQIGYEPYYQTFRVDSKAAVGLVIQAENGANLRLISQSIDSIGRELQNSDSLMSQVQISRVLDPADYINLAIRNVIYSGLSGALLAIIVVIIFLGQLRNIVMIAFSIPLTIIMSLSLLYYMGISINMISLGGMTIATGMVVDASIVVTENIHRIRIEQPQLRAWQAISYATKQVWLPVLVSTLTSVVVFLPLSFTAPLANAILGDLAHTIVFALLCSLLVALFVVPLLAFYMFRNLDSPTAYATGKQHKTNRLERHSERFSAALVAGYRRLLRSFLVNRHLQWLFVTFSAALFALSLTILVPRIQQTIIDTPSSDRVVLSVYISPRYKDQQDFVDFTDGVSAKIHQILGNNVKTVFAQSFGTDAVLFMSVLTSSRYGQEAKQTLQQYFDQQIAHLAQRHKVAQATNGSEGKILSDIESLPGENAESLEVLDPNRKYNFQVEPWDPAALPLPQNEDLRLELQGTKPASILESLSLISRLISEDQQKRIDRAQEALSQAKASQTKKKSEENIASKGNEATGEAELDAANPTIESNDTESLGNYLEGFRYSISKEPSSQDPQPILKMLPRQGLLEKFSDLHLDDELGKALGSTVSELKVNLGEDDEDEDGSSTHTVRIRNPNSVQNYQDIYNYPIQVQVKTQTQSGTSTATQYIPLHHFVTFERGEQESMIKSLDGRRQFYIALTISHMGSDAATPKQIAAAKREIEALLQANPDALLPGVTYSWFNTKQDTEEAIRSLGLALAIALLLVFLVLTAQFGSYRYPLIILVTIPLGITGSLFFLWLSRSNISLNSLLGMILLGGIAVNNAIIMIDFVLLTLKERTTSKMTDNYSFAKLKLEAIVDACSLRLTPILITMLTTLLGMLPIAFALGDGMNVLQPLGIAVAGGLAVSTMFTLFMTPCLLNAIPTKRDRQLAMSFQAVNSSLSQEGPQECHKEAYE